ncbi:type IV toxin-antitoxin system AbiEi family antitoxin domain-containing protein [Kribbia dieselivorans]|uniref:type IV toxin-antitoxin system AbiEi family antitoxin domain-containing protein n=1 Tax=Kribbia dieselivorans TaxID=331526 RepID=UPI0012ED2A17|nr:type IV toxin-antitoxin system AbiEi family antitoxin domain-containing protein [Kribbia dieselivorans]
MDERIQTTLRIGGGVASAQRILALGISRDMLARSVRVGELVRIRRNCLVDGALWQEAQPSERHALRARAVMAGLPRGHTIALSHHSALALHGVALFGVDQRVHLTHLGSGRGRSDSVVVSHRPVPQSLVEARGGIRMVTAAAACLQVAAQFGAEAGLVAADNALHTQLLTVDDLEQARRVLAPERWSRAPAEMCRLADARMESPAESRARWAFRSLNMRQPTPQVEIRDSNGFIGRVDFLYEDLKVVIEVDGRIKYSGTNVVFAEKVREDRIRALGFQVVRLTWADLDDHARVHHKVFDAVAKAVA